MNTFHNWLSEAKVVSIYDVFFRNSISIVYLGINTQVIIENCGH